MLDFVLVVSSFYPLVSHYAQENPISARSVGAPGCQNARIYSICKQVRPSLEGKLERSVGMGARHCRRPSFGAGFWNLRAWICVEREDGDGEQFIVILSLGI